MPLKKAFSIDPRPRAIIKISTPQSMHKSTSIMERIFNRNLSDAHDINDVNPTCTLDNHIHTDFKRKFLREFESELLYTESVLKQRLDELNHNNLINQMNKCSLLISKRLSESQKFIESLQFDTVQFAQLQDLLNQIQLSHQRFTEWIESLSCGDIADQTVGKEAFSRLGLVSKAFISHLKESLDVKADERKRNSIDNGCIRSNINRPQPSYKSRFSDEEKAFIAKLERMKEASDQVLSNSQRIYSRDDSTKIEQEPGHQDAEILSCGSVKLESNCAGVRSPSFTNCDSCHNDFPDFSDQITQNVEYRKKITYISNQDQDPITDFRRSLPEKDKNIPLPEVPYLFKHLAKSKSLQVPTSFHSEEHHFRRTSILSKDRPDSTNSAISNFSNKSPLRSPTFVSCLNLQTNIKDFKRLSNHSTDNADCLPIDTTEKKSTSETIISVQEIDEPNFRTEVKSDTEEYFEYFEMNGVKYRQKMKKRTVIEKIKIQKTVFAPLLADGSGPDLEKSCGNDDNEISQAPYNDHCNQSEDALKEVSLSDKAVIRRYTEEKLRISRSMFLPYPENMKALTINNDLKNQHINVTPALLTNYMYRIGKADFEEPVVDKRLSSQLLDDVNSVWIKKPEFNLHQHKSRSICYFNKCPPKYVHGNTIRPPPYIPSSRTMRVKSQDNLLELSLESQIKVAEPSIGNQDDCNESVTTIDTSNDGRSESSILCTDDEKELGSSLSESCMSALQEDTQSTLSTMDDSDYHDSLIDDPSDPIPYMSTRSPSPDPGFYICDHNSFLSETKDHFSFILLENNPIPFLIFDKDTKLGECDIAGGPVDALIVYACDGEENLLFLGAFLDTYRTFIEPEDLIKRLIIRYKYFRSKQSVDDKDFNAKREDSGYTDSTEDILRHRRKPFDSDDPEKKCIHILSLLLTIIGKLKRDLNEHISSLIMSFENFLQEIGETQWIHAINNTIKNQKQAMDKDTEMVQIVNQMTLRPQSLTDSKSPKEKNSPTISLSYFITYKESILEFSSYEIAEQMTLLDWGKYRDVELIEILNLKDIANCKLTGVIEYAKHFENVQYWTQSILLDPDKKTSSERDKYCLKFIRIMKHLRKQCNFSSLIAILLGIQLLPLDKLFSKRVRSKIIEMDDYMKPTKFIGYKEDLKQAVAPCIPFLGIFYQDVVMLNIANPPYLDGNEIDYIGRLSVWSTHNNQTIPLNMEHYGPIVNFWRSFKQYLFLKNCNKDQDKIRYSIKANEKILQFLGNYRERYDEATIQRLIKQI